MEAAVGRLVRRRASERCEYCRMPQSATPFSRFNIEHIIARQHDGSDDESNLALACPRCNSFKGPNLSAIDPQTKQLVALFNPRTDIWDEHFELERGLITGLTGVGRATVRLLKMNAQDRVKLRRTLIRRGEY
jgi:HNH endonuclease